MNTTSIAALSASAVGDAPTTTTMIGTSVIRGTAFSAITSGRTTLYSSSLPPQSSPPTPPTITPATEPTRAVPTVIPTSGQMAPAFDVPVIRSQTVVATLDGELMKNGSRNLETFVIPGISGTPSHAPRKTATINTCQNRRMSRF